ncbi:hypothetical protein U1Q18_030902 [Sarracenia purpurea var. burkii]
MLGVPGVIDKGGSELTACRGPDLDSRRVSTVGTESNAADPVGGGNLCSGGDDPSAVDQEGDEEDVFGGADETAGSGAGWEVLGTKLVPWWCLRLIMVQRGRWQPPTLGVDIARGRPLRIEHVGFLHLVYE